MTFGSGSSGCLGHGDFNDVAQVNALQPTSKPVWWSCVIDGLM